MYLLDTNVVSEMRRARPHGAVLAWFGRVAESDLYIAAVTIGEIQAGIENTRTQDKSKAAEIENWLEGIASNFNVVDMDVRAFRCWGRLMHRKAENLIRDAMIASVAVVHNFTVVTRNVKDFRNFNVRVFNPFETSH